MKRSKVSINSAKKVKQILLSLLGIGLFALLIMAAISIRNKNSSVIIIDIDTLGEDRSMLVEKDIKNILERTYGFDLVGVPINNIDVLSVENLLKNVPHIKDANIFIDALNKVHVEVVPRKAILRIIDENGSNYFLDEDGIRLPISNNLHQEYW
jgi:cell division protein FtsQ